MSPITTHVLDTSTGKPASGMPVTLERKTQGDVWKVVAKGVTDDDGRIKNLLSSDDEVPLGVYRLTFETGHYFHIWQTECLFPQVMIAFIVKDNKQHFHIPLLLSPFGYSTYRGS